MHLVLSTTQLIELYNSCIKWSSSVIHVFNATRSIETMQTTFTDQSADSLTMEIFFQLFKAALYIVLVISLVIFNIKLISKLISLILTICKLQKFLLDSLLHNDCNNALDFNWFQCHASCGIFCKMEITKTFKTEKCTVLREYSLTNFWRIDRSQRNFIYCSWMTSFQYNSYCLIEHGGHVYMLYFSPPFEWRKLHKFPVQNGPASMYTVNPYWGSMCPNTCSSKDPDVVNR